METLDYIILIVYMIGIVCMGYYLGRSNKSSEDYFIAGRSLPWYAIGLSVGVTMISANSFIGGPGWGYTDGIIAAMVNISVPLSIFFITYTVLPVIYNSKVTTVYEYVNLRFGPKTRMLNVIVWLCSSLILMGGFVYTPSLVLGSITTIPMNTWVPIIVVLAIIYTALGGIKAVVWTDAIQACILLLGLIFAVFYALSMTDGGITEVMAQAKEAGKLLSFDFNFQRTSLNIWCCMIGGFSMWIGYFGFDQGQVQRYLTAKNIKNIKKGGIMSTAAMQLIYWVCMFLGVVFFVFYKNNPSTLDFENVNNIMTDFLLNYVPAGLLGILLAATFAAAMSSVDSILNSLTAVFTKDVYEPYISKQKNTPLSRTIIFSVAFGVLIIGFVYAGLNDNNKSILDKIGEYLSPFGALITGTMITAVFMPRVNDKGAFLGMIIAFAATFSTGKIATQITGDGYPLHWLWVFFYGAVYCIVFSYICSLFFEDTSERTKKYTIQGMIKDLGPEATDNEGVSIVPLVMDKYGWIIVAMGIVQTILLFVLQG